jgi:pimeloyl-ACP methyl ester carboxylesterase
VALLCAANHPSIRAIGLKSASTFLPEGYQLQYGAELMARWAEEGYSDEVGLNYGAVIDSLFHNTYSSASRISCPVRVVNGTADSAVPIRHARDLVRVIPRASLLEIEGADHWYAEGDEWERMAVDILDFIDAVL